MCAALVLLTATSAGAQAAGVFIPLEPERSVATTVAAQSVTGAVDRERDVAIDFSELERVRASLSQPASAPVAFRLNLFDDTSYEAFGERVAPTFSGGYSIVARIADEPLGRATLVVNGATVAGTVRTSRGTWRIRAAGDGRFVVGEVDSSKLPPLCAVEDAPHQETRTAVRP